MAKTLIFAVMMLATLLGGWWVASVTTPPALAGEDTPAVRIEQVKENGLRIYTDRETGVVCYSRSGYSLSCVQPWPTEPEAK